MNRSRSPRFRFTSRLVLAALLVVLFWLLFPSLRAEGTWEERYQLAHQARSANEELAIRLFRDVADHAGPDLASRALLQIALIYRQTLMEPRKALKVLEEFNSLPGAAQHRSYAESVRVRTLLKSALDEIDALEINLPSPPDARGTTATLMSIGDVYRYKLDTPNYAFGFYDRAYTASSKTLDVAGFLRGHCKMEIAEYPEAAAIFEDFIKRFPDSHLYASSFDLLYRCKYLRVFHMKIAFQRNHEGAKLIREIDQALAANPKLDPDVRQRLKNYRRLTAGLLPVNPPAGKPGSP